jgi:hypothetical protein
MRCAGLAARMAEGRGVYRGFVGGPEGKISVGKPRHRWEDNIKMDLNEIGFGGLKWIRLPQVSVHWRAFVNKVMNPRVQ